MKHSERPIDMLERQMAANRAAVRYRHPTKNTRHFCHIKEFKKAFFDDTIALRSAIKEKRNDVINQSQS